MESNIVDWSKGRNHWETYNKDKPNTPVATDTSQLTDEEKDLVYRAINKVFVNPKFKMKYFVSGAQITPYHELRQLFLELRAQEESLENLLYVLKKLPTELEICKLRQERETDPLIQKEIELKILEIERDLAQAKRRYSQNFIERHQWLDLIKEFLASDKNKTEDGKSLLTVFDTPLEDEYEAKYWTLRLAKQAAMDISSYGNISAGNLDAITQLPLPQQTEVFSYAYSYHTQLSEHQLAIKQEVQKQILEGSIKEDQNKKIENNGDLKDVYSL